MLARKTSRLGSTETMSLTSEKCVENETVNHHRESSETINKLLSNELIVLPLDLWDDWCFIFRFFLSCNNDEFQTIIFSGCLFLFCF